MERMIAATAVPYNTTGQKYNQTDHLMGSVRPTANNIHTSESVNVN